MVLELSAARRQFRGSPRLSAVAAGVSEPHGDGVFVSRQHVAPVARSGRFPRGVGVVVGGGVGDGGVPAGVELAGGSGGVGGDVAGGAGTGGAGV